MDVTKQTFNLSKINNKLHLHKLSEFDMSSIYWDKLTTNNFHIQMSSHKVKHLKIKNLELQQFVHRKILRGLDQLLI
jgi:hypothetical protein